MINYEEIIKNLDSEKVKNLLDNLKIPFRETENALIMPTVCHNEDIDSASWKLYYYKNTHIFYCYTECSKAMSIFKFLEQFYTTRQIEYDWYQDIYQTILNCSIAKEIESFQQEKRVNLKEKYQKKGKPQLKIYPSGILDVFNKYYPVEWLNDGISKETMDKFNILYSISQNKIIIPHYDIDGNLVGIRGRALNEQDIKHGKYMPVKIENIIYKHPLSLNLYGLNFNKDNIKKNRYAYLCEGEKSVLQFESFNQPNCAVAVCGSNFNKFQLNLLIKECHPKEIIICFDKEEKKNEDKYFMKLWNIGQKYKNYCDFSFIYDTQNLLKMKDSPIDHGEVIFNQLKERRIKIK